MSETKEQKGNGGFIVFDSEEQRVTLINVHNDLYNRYLRAKRRALIAEEQVKALNETLNHWTEYPPHNPHESQEHSVAHNAYIDALQAFNYWQQQADRDLSHYNTLNPLIQQINYEN